MQQTDIGQLIGTLQYMSPEQCEGDPHDIDTRSDVYALGMVFYELLCSKLPYDVTRMAMHQATRAIRELHPTKLSTLDRTLRGDVETIALKALEKERERRYQSAADFGHDIHRYLTGEAILARRASIVYQLRLFARRNKAVFASLAATFVVLLAGIIVSTTLYVRAEHARVEQTRERERAELAAAEAQRERDAAQVVTKYLTSMLSSADPQQAQGREVTVRELLDKAAQDIPTIFRDQPLIEATLRSAIGRTHIALGLYEAAEPHLRRALEIRHKLLGDDHPDTLTTMYDLGIVLHDLGRLAEAEPLYRVSLEGRRRILGAEHPETLMSIDKLSWLFEDQGKLAEAEPLRWQVVEVRRRVLGPEDLWTLTSEGWLAKILVARGKFSEGERVYRATLDTQRRVFGDDHWRPLYTIGHLARALRFAGKLEEAESLYRLSLPKMRTVLGAEHPDLAYSLTGLGLILADTGRAAEAEPMLLEALELRRGRLPAGHWEIAITENALGFCYASLGRYQAAESLLLPSFSRVRQALGEEHVETRDTLGHVVQLYDAWDAAEPGKGYAEKAAQWRAKLDETSKNQNVETPQRRNAAIGNVKKISERIIRRFRRWTQIKRAKQQKICEKLRNLRISCCCSST
jgi:tetratricopeptide (TPR) repeat protein